MKPNSFFSESARNVLSECKEKFLNLRQKPARIMAEQVAWLIGVEEHDIPILVRAQMLTPLGDPARNGPKYFSTLEIEKLCTQRSWLDRMSKVITKHWRHHNARKTSSAPSRLVKPMRA